MNAPSALVRSLKARGGRRSLERLLEHVSDRWFDLRYGTQTCGNRSLSGLAVTGPHRDPGRRYQPTSSLAFRGIMRCLDLPRDGVFVDLGSGKGKALLLAALHGFRRIVGVEFSPELCAAALHNVRRFTKRTRGSAEIRVVEADAADWPIDAEANVFFLFNPFGPAVMRRVLDRIEASLERHPRTVWLIYHNPVEEATLLSNGRFESRAELHYGGFPIKIYTPK